MEELEKIAVVNLLQHRSIISLIGNVQKSSLILEKVLYMFCSFTWRISLQLSLKLVKMIANFVCVFLLVLYDIVWITLSFLTCGEYSSSLGEFFSYIYFKFFC